MLKKWEVSPSDKNKQRLWSQKLAVSPAAAGILIKRGWSLEKAAAFLHTDSQDFYDPLLLPNMRSAVARIKAAIYRKELITIFGDYDVDGITATTVLYKTLKGLGACVEYYLPDRQLEGYGIHKESIDKFKNKTKLLISVDCGIRSVSEAEYAGNYMDVIITDHHLPGEQLPGALAVIDPKREDSEYPDENLAGVGVSFKLCQALWQNMRNESFTKYLDIVALGTVADIVPLLDENRKFVQTGLKSITNTGLLSLIKTCGLDKDKITAGHIGFILGPRFNAAGRLEHASIGVELLLTEDKQRADELALHLDEENKIRQQLVEKTFEEAKKMVLENNYDKTAAIVVAGKDWHQGIIGIVASRLVDEFYRPTIVISIDEEKKRGKGSCRSIKNFNICNALTECGDLLAAYGGHAMAAGLSLDAVKLNEFREKFTRCAGKNLTDEDFYPLLQAQSVLKPEDVTKELIADIRRLEPFGMGNASPLFLCGGIKPDTVKKMGKNSEHLRFTFSSHSSAYTAIGWRMGNLADDLQNKTLDFIFQPEINLWQDKEYIQFVIRDIRESKSYPTHDDIGRFYIFLKKLSAAKDNAPLSANLLAASYSRACGADISEHDIIYCLNVLDEISIIKFEPEKNTISFLPPPDEKKDLADSAAFLERYNGL